jgi:hypothetical protein
MLTDGPLRSRVATTWAVDWLTGAVPAGLHRPTPGSDESGESLERRRVFCGQFLILRRGLAPNLHSSEGVGLAQALGLDEPWTTPGAGRTTTVRLASLEDNPEGA